MRRARRVGGVYVRRQFHFLGDCDCRPDGQLVREAVRDISRAGGRRAERGDSAEIVGRGQLLEREQCSGVAGRAEYDRLVLADGKRRERQIIQARRERDSLRVGERHGRTGGAGREHIADVGHTDGHHAGCGSCDGQLCKGNTGIAGFAGIRQIVVHQRSLTRGKIDAVGLEILISEQTDGVFGIVRGRGVDELVGGAHTARPEIAVVADIGAVALVALVALISLVTLVALRALRANRAGGALSAGDGGRGVFRERDVPAGGGIEHADEDRRDLAALDAGIGIEITVRVGTGQDAGAIERIDLIRIEIRGRDVGDGVVLHGVPRGIAPAGHRVIENMDKLRAADGAVHQRGLVGRIFRLNDPICNRIGYIGAVPRAAVFQRDSAGLRLLVQRGGQLDGLRNGQCACGAEACGRHAVDESLFMGIFHVGIIPAEHGHILKRQRCRRDGADAPAQDHRQHKQQRSEPPQESVSTGCDRSCHVFSFFR